MRVRVRPGAQPPAYVSGTSPILELRAAITSRWYVHDGESIEVPTGVALEVPVDFAALVMQAPVLLQNGVRVAQLVIDSSNRDEVRVTLSMFAAGKYRVEPGDVVAELIVVPALRLPVSVVEELPEVRVH